MKLSEKRFVPHAKGRRLMREMVKYLEARYGKSK